MKCSSGGRNPQLGSSVVRTPGIYLGVPGFKSQSGHFSVTLLIEVVTNCSVWSLPDSPRSTWISNMVHVKVYVIGIGGQNFSSTYVYFLFFWPIDMKTAVSRNVPRGSVRNPISYDPWWQYHKIWPTVGQVMFLVPDFCIAESQIGHM
jgi:hypothetical protein